jgi:putative membrane protein
MRLLALVIVAQIGFPLTGGRLRAADVVVTVVIGFIASVRHAARTRGVRFAVALFGITAGFGLIAELLGVHTGIPFSRYGYTGALGPVVAGVPLVIPLAWTWMAWPAWLSAGIVFSRPAPRVSLAAIGLAAWDLFLDPQMVAQGYWHWISGHPALPGVPGIPVWNYLGWLLVSLLLMAAVAGLPHGRGDDRVMVIMYLWVFVSSFLYASAVDPSGPAWWGAFGMGLLALPVAALAFL